ARAGQWLIMVPGQRYQEFTSHAELISINLSVSCGAAILSWMGKWACVLKEDSRLLAQAEALAAALPPVSPGEDHGLSIPGVKMPLQQAADCQARVLDFFNSLLVVASEWGVGVDIQFGEDERVQRSLAYMTNRPLGNKFSREEVAEDCGLSASRLDRHWRREMGITIRQYWDNRRMNYACQCLREKTKSIKEVSADLGFSHASQFSIWFSSHQGVSPRAYRRSIV
ncbi:MAG: helix-turn-helix domain-containing protein, partial [Puniceicoccales bacterium]